MLVVYHVLGFLTLLIDTCLKTPDLEYTSRRETEKSELQARSTLQQDATLFPKGIMPIYTPTGVNVKESL